VWLLTGADEASVLLAARALAGESLAHHFALALAPGGASVPLPISR
jgi:hypothetical protein